MLVAVPFVGFVLGDRKRKVHWVDLGPVDDFDLNQTRLVTFDNPLRAAVGRHHRADRRLRAQSGQERQDRRRSSWC